MTSADRVEVTVMRRRTDYFWGLLFDGLSSRMFWLAVLIPPVAQGALYFKRTEGAEATARALEISAQVALTGVVVAAAVVSIFYFAARFSASAPGRSAPATYAISHGGIANSGATAPWSGYRGAIETKALFILQQEQSAIQIFPKRDLSTQAIAGLRRLLRENLGRRAHVQEKAS
ncbi:MAG: YcxB family protein [Hyphomonadaceae bacterium]|nr:YcxB family protein [Hyphomonadaceae bacterium]